MNFGAIPETISIIPLNIFRFLIVVNLATAVGDIGGAAPVTADSAFFVNFPGAAVESAAFAAYP